MPICTKCREEKNGIDGKKASFLLFLGAIPLTWLFGFSTGIFMVGFAVYLHIAHSPQKFICGDCLPGICPECQKPYTIKTYCKSCKIITCPFCGNIQQYDTSLSWVAALGSTLLFFIGLIIILLGLLFAPWILVVFFMFYFYYSSPKCNQCGERISTMHF